MMKYSKLIFAVMALVVFVGTFVFLWRKSLPQEVKYNEFTPKRENIVKSTIITGRIEPRDEVNVKPQISGIISEIYKEAGETVKADEVIAKVKVIPEMNQLTAAQSRVRIADINLNQVKTDYERYQRLFDKELVSASEYEKICQQYRQAQEEKVAADDALLVVSEGISRSNANASSTLIRSTISGLILDVPVKVGNSVILSNTFNEGTTIASVANMNDLIFRGNIDESEVGRIHAGMPMNITIGALQDLNFDAILEYISPKAVQSNGANQFEIKASVTIRDSVQMRSGYSANAEIVLAEAQDVLSVPESAIEFSGDSTFVYVVRGDGDKKNYVRTHVVTGLSDGVKIEIKKGISEKDIIRGPQIIE
ncbi:MAG: efflux RND transporter periplasmic adaptor subunit [Bacteroidaceae bacterium]|nr:efflux RND transporter periplasmic adaptor subunit [Bacteroidaceae bacterium]